MRFAVEAAPHALHFGQDFLAPANHRVVERARAGDLFQHGFRDHGIVQERRAAIGDLVLQGDPRLARHFFRRGEFLPMGEHRVLHPAEIAGVVHMAHEVDVFGVDGNRMAEGLC